MLMVITYFLTQQTLCKYIVCSKLNNKDIKETIQQFYG